MLAVLLVAAAGCASPTSVRISEQPTPPVERTLPAIDTLRVERAVVSSEAPWLETESERNFVRAREAYWNRRTDEAVALWRGLLIRTNSKTSVDLIFPGFILQAYEEDGRWADALAVGREFGVDQTHPQRLATARTLADVVPPLFEFQPGAPELGFELRREQLVLARGRLNGHPARFFLDTGFSRTFVAAAFARKAGLQLRAGAVFINDSHSREREARWAVTSDLSIAGMTVRGLPVVVGDVGKLSRIVGEVDVVLGWDVLQHTDVSWNFPDRLLRITRPEGQPGPAPVLSGRQAPILRMVSPDGHPLELFLDTGFAPRPASVTFNRNARLLDSHIARGRFRRGLAPSFSSGMYSVGLRWPRVARNFPLWFDGWELTMPRATVRSRVEVREGLQACDGMIGNAPFLGGTLRLNAQARLASFSPAARGTAVASATE